jgi:putative ATPase
MLQDRDTLLEAAGIQRHDRVLIARADDGLLIWESFRRTPEGLTCGIVRNTAAEETLLRYAASLEGEEKPVIGVLNGLPSILPSIEEAKALFGSGVFDHILAREPWRGEKDPYAAFTRFALAARALITDGGSAVILQSPPAMGQRLSAFVGDGDEGLAKRLAAAEDMFFARGGDNDGGADASPWSWTADDVKAAFSAAGFFAEVTVTILERREERIIGESDLAHWFDREKSPWGKFISEKLGTADFLEAQKRIGEKAKTGPLVWQWRSVLLKAALATMRPQ